MSNKAYGLGKEREIKKRMLKGGATSVMRCRGSFGAFDVIAFFNNRCVLISVKSTRKAKYDAKPELRKLRLVQVPHYCNKELHVWVNRKWNVYTIS